MIGVLTVLTASYDVLGRVGGTVLATAIAAGFLWPLSMMIDQPKTLASGLFGMTSTVVVYCLVIPLIWNLDPPDEKVLFTSLAIGWTTPAGMVTLLMTSFPKVRFAGRSGTALFVAVLASFCVAIWHTGDWRDRSDWWELGWWLAGYGVLSVACLAGWIPGRLPDWRWLGVLASAAAWWSVMLHEWGDHPLYEKWITLLTTVGIVVAHTSLTLLVPLSSGQRWVRIGTSVAVVTTGFFLNLELLISPAVGMSMLGRMAGAAGVVASCGTLALMVLARLNRRIHQNTETARNEITEVVMFCPACGKKQTILLSGGECSRCGLIIHVAVAREPDQQLTSSDGSR
jgi:hypothetical protein